MIGLLNGFRSGFRTPRKTRPYAMRHNSLLKEPVTEWVWLNPHTLLKIDIKDDNGKVVNWIVEWSAPSSLVNFGINKQTFKPGMMVTVVMITPDNGAPVGRIQRVMLANGKWLRGRLRSRSPERRAAKRFRYVKPLLVPTIVLAASMFHLLRALKILRGRRFLRPIQVLCCGSKSGETYRRLVQDVPVPPKDQRQPRLLAMTCRNLEPPQGGGTESNSLVRRNTHRTGSIFCRSRLWGESVQSQ